ncbi:MAG TPA: hypothetical protein VNA17_08685 [Pyrinomonadaceae bacterium]|nr:hypothetical protein [Pyrinomonadaceae bacterium]
MEQTFDDLCRERDGRPATLVSLTLHVSVDTGIGIVKEHILHFSKGGGMRAVLMNPRTTAILGFLLTLPGAAMVTLLMLQIEPPMGPLGPYLERPVGHPHVLGSLAVLAIVIMLPAIGLVLNAGKIRNAMLSAGNLTAATLGGLALTVPFLVLQLMNKPPLENIPVVLFVVLWLLSTIFIATLLPIVKGLRSEGGMRTHPAAIILSGIVLIIVTAMWSGIIVDQMPCFLGVPNCD